MEDIGTSAKVGGMGCAVHDRPRFVIPTAGQLTGGCTAGVDLRPRRRRLSEPVGSCIDCAMAEDLQLGWSYHAFLAIQACCLLAIVTISCWGRGDAPCDIT